MCVAVARMDIEFGYAVPRMTNKYQRNMFYTPEFETERKDEVQPYSSTDVGQPAGMSLIKLNQTKFDDYRCGFNHFQTPVNWTGTWLSRTVFQDPATSGIDQVLLNQYVQPSEIDVIFNDQYGAGNHLNTVNTMRFTRLSPIRSAQAVGGVS